jgi:hypothetical protein
MQVMHHSFKAGHRNKSNENHYSNYDSEIVAGDRLTPAQAKLACCVVKMAS